VTIDTTLSIPAAYHKGAKAFHAGEGADTCPYPHTGDGLINDRYWWFQGWYDVKHEPLLGPQSTFNPEYKQCPAEPTNRISKHQPSRPGRSPC